MTAKRKRPKVQYVVDGHRYWQQALFAVRLSNDDSLPSVYTTTRLDARKIAAALNLYEATRRGEM